MANLKEAGKLICSIVICQLAGVFGSLFTMPAIPTWYASLTKPSFAPPGWLIGTIWLILYTLMGISLYLIWISKKKETKVAVGVFGVQLALNALWSFLFFGLKSPLYGLICILLMWTAIAATIAIAAMSFGDGMGELVGRRYGKTHYSPHRTLEGSLAVFLATLASILVLSWFYFGLIDYWGGTQPELLALFALVVAGFVALLEAVTPGAVDNLVLPLLVAGWLHMMGV